MARSGRLTSTRVGWPDPRVELWRPVLTGPLALTHVDHEVSVATRLRHADNFVRDFMINSR
jgi:hypothetical protein